MAIQTNTDLLQFMSQPKLSIGLAAALGSGRLGAPKVGPTISMIRHGAKNWSLPDDFRSSMIIVPRRSWVASSFFDTPARRIIKSTLVRDNLSARFDSSRCLRNATQLLESIVKPFNVKLWNYLLKGPHPSTYYVKPSQLWRRLQTCERTMSALHRLEQSQPNSDLLVIPVGMPKRVINVTTREAENLLERDEFFLTADMLAYGLLAQLVGFNIDDDAMQISTYTSIAICCAGSEYKLSVDKTEHAGILTFSLNAYTIRIEAERRDDATPRDHILGFVPTN